eukprot:4432420-Pleurochrysis_carterae.AAC.1
MSAPRAAPTSSTRRRSSPPASSGNHSRRLAFSIPSSEKQTFNPEFTPAPARTSLVCCQDCIEQRPGKGTHTRFGWRADAADETQTRLLQTNLIHLLKTASWQIYILESAPQREVSCSVGKIACPDDTLYLVAALPPEVVLAVGL